MIRMARNSIAFVSNEGNYTSNDINRAADQLAIKYLDIVKKFDFRNTDIRPTFLIASSKPASFLAGLLACRKTNIIAVPWRDSTIPYENLAETVRADVVVQFIGNT